jgi:hypothetical protein
VATKLTDVMILFNFLKTCLIPRQANSFVIQLLEITEYSPSFSLLSDDDGFSPFPMPT